MASSTAPTTLPTRGPVSARFAELVDELIGMAADRGIEHLQAVIVSRVAQRLALADELESGGNHLCLDRCRLDPVERVGGGDPGAGGAGMIDHDIGPAGLQQIE